MNNEFWYLMFLFVGFVFGAFSLALAAYVEEAQSEKESKEVASKKESVQTNEFLSRVIEEEEQESRVEDSSVSRSRVISPAAKQRLNEIEEL